MTALLGILGGLRGVLMAAAGGIVTLGFVLTWNAMWDNPRVLKQGIEQGTRAEKAAWEEIMVGIRLAQEAARHKAQAEIDALERDYLNQRASDTARILTLDILISQMEAQDEADLSGNPSCPRPPAIPHGLSNQLNQIGR